MLCFRGCNRFFFNCSSMWFTDVHYLGLTSFAAIAMFFLERAFRWPTGMIWFRDDRNLRSTKRHDVSQEPSQKNGSFEANSYIYIYILYMPCRDLSERVAPNTLFPSTGQIHYIKSSIPSLFDNSPSRPPRVVQAPTTKNKLHKQT